jgi:ribosomal protein L17
MTELNEHRAPELNTTNSNTNLSMQPYLRLTRNLVRLFARNLGRHILQYPGLINTTTRVHDLAQYIAQTITHKLLEDLMRRKHRSLNHYSTSNVHQLLDQLSDSSQDLVRDLEQDLEQHLAQYLSLNPGGNSALNTL